MWSLQWTERKTLEIAISLVVPLSAVTEYESRLNGSPTFLRAKYITLGSWCIAASAISYISHGLYSAIVDWEELLLQLSTISICHIRGGGAYEIMHSTSE